MKRARMLRAAIGGALILTSGLALAAPAGAAAKHAVTYKFTVSKLAWTGSSTVIAATDSRGDLYCFSEASGSTKWHEQVVAKARTGVSYGKPAIAWTGTSVFIAAVNQAGALVYFVHSGGTWRGHVLSHATDGGHRKWLAPSVAGVSGEVLVIDGNGFSGGALKSWRLGYGASQWSESTVASGNYGASSLTITPDGPSGDVRLTATSGGTVYYWSEMLGITAWSLEKVAAPGPQGSFGAGAVTAADGSSVVTAATSSGAVDSWYPTAAIGGTAWNQQAVTAASHPAASPVIASFQQVVRFHLYTYVVIAATGPHGQLDFWWQVATGTWYPETIAKAGRLAAYGSPSISINGSAVIVTAVNTKSGNLMFWYQDYGASQWHTQLVAKG